MRDFNVSYYEIHRRDYTTYDDHFHDKDIIFTNQSSTSNNDFSLGYLARREATILEIL